MAEYCNNCGLAGHNFKECNHPKTSYGIVCVKKDEKGILNYLLICRRFSLSYIEFIRGRYKIFDSNILFNLFKHMTIYERNDILTKDFDTLWDALWINNKYKKTDPRSDYIKGKEKFILLKEGIIIPFQCIKISLEYLTRNSYSIYTEPEWDFPKGRRNTSENDYDCALREFSEETNFKKSNIKIHKDLGEFVEIHRGTNGIRYRTIYFLGEFVGKDSTPVIDEKNKHQAMEISQIGWYNFEDGMGKFREYDDEKKNVISNVYKKLMLKDSNIFNESTKTIKTNI